MTLIKSSAFFPTSDNMYYVNTECILQDGKPAIEHVQRLIQQLLTQDTDTSRDEQLVFHTAMEQVKKNIFVTIDKQEGCKNIEEAIHNGLYILSRNDRHTEIVTPLLRVYDKSLQDTSLPAIDTAYSALVASRDIQHEIQSVYEKLLPMIAKRNNKDMQYYGDMGLWNTSTETINMPVILKNIKDGIEEIRTEQEALQARLLYLSQISADQKKELLNKININSLVKFKELHVKSSLGSDKTIRVELVPVDQRLQSCCIYKIDASNKQLTYSAPNRSYNDQTNALDMIKEEARKYYMQ